MNYSTIKANKNFFTPVDNAQRFSIAKPFADAHFQQHYSKASPLRLSIGARLKTPVEVRSIDSQITLVFTLAQHMPQARLLPLRAYLAWQPAEGMCAELSLHTAHSYAATFEPGSPVLVIGEGLRLVRDAEHHTEDHLRIITCVEVCLIKLDSPLMKVFQS
jgi:hypothetical protein